VDEDPKYDSDFHAWAAEQAALLRTGRVAEADIQHIAEEIETLGRGERRELVNRLSVLLLHMLKWSYQPERQGRSWELTIKEQRRALSLHLRDNPSLAAQPESAMADAYGNAALRMAQETGLLEDMLPWSCPYTFAEAMDPDFWPGKA